MEIDSHANEITDTDLIVPAKAARRSFAHAA